MRAMAWLSKRGRSRLVSAAGAMQAKWVQIRSRGGLRSSMRVKTMVGDESFTDTK